MESYPFDICRETDAPTSPTDRALYITRQPEWRQGVEVAARPVSAGTNTGVLAMVVAVFVLVGLNMRHVRHLFRTVPQDLWSVRRRSNVFDDHTANEKRTVFMLLLMLWVFEGILLFLGFGTVGERSTDMSVFHTVLALTALSGVFYLFSLGAVTLVGYVFTDKVNAGLWKRGLNASCGCLGVCLALPALVSLFYPLFTEVMLLVAVSMYVLSRLVFIVKGFRIFYINFPSLLYFILYLCTLEIIPVLVICYSATEICRFFD